MKDLMYTLKHTNGVPVYRNKKVRVFTEEQANKYLAWLEQQNVRVGTYNMEPTEHTSDYDP